MKTITLAAAIVATLLLLPTLVRADIITVTATGTIVAGGINDAGLFGGGSLAGKSFTATLMFDSTLGKTFTYSNGEALYGGTQTGFSPPGLSADLVINGYDFAFSTSGYSVLATQTSQFSAEAGQPGGGNYETILSLYLADPSTNDLPSTFSFPTFNTTTNDQQNQSYFNIAENGLRTFNFFNTTTVTSVASDPVGVPGPVVGAGLPGLLAGFGMLGAYWKRRKQTTA